MLAASTEAKASRKPAVAENGVMVNLSTGLGSNKN